MLAVTIISVPLTKVMPIVIVTIAISWHLSQKALTCSLGGLWRLQAVIAIVTRGGNSFKGANLTDVDFTGATLKFCDFREASLTCTRFYEVKALNYARLDNTYLANPQIRQLVVTLNGQAQNFDGLNLEGVNLQGANLQDASFIGTNLNNANLRNANLSRAILKQAQLDGTNMTGAILTGACIEDWGITGSTKLEDVQCDYVFMRLETKDNPNRLRKPDNWGETFAQGEFADFIKPYVDTLDLYHSQDIDPRAISIALKNLSTNHPEQELRFVAIERRGNNGLNLRFTTAAGADKSELSHQYFRDYARIKKELPLAVQLKLAEQDGEIRTLKDTIEQFIETGTHQSKIHAETIQIIKGELVMTQNKGINIHSGGGSIGDISGLVGGDGVVNLGTISGSVTNTLNQLPDSSEPSEPNIKELLAQLQQAIESDSDLSDPDKVDLLEQVQALAEAKQTEEPAKKQGLTRKARKMFEATLSSLPQTASIVEACTKLLPMILKGLGLPA
ncbi:pentapeptide repeat-containing protein [Microcoleus sp. AT9b-C3]|uniref:pentapeptide repeat-containing protein n=1 Tax=Microcoleus sp. AT9b-C3 TaxID=2818629 RepID=UPI002FD4175E